MNNGQIKRIVQDIWDDICGRSGGDHFLESCNVEVQEEIKQTWYRVIEKVSKERPKHESL